MGGNKKQRTKGNVKPSSSQRTAELLSASGVTGFIGFSGLSANLPGYVPPSGQQLSDDVELTVDGDFRMVMRKMTKRDTVTKIKALQEFSHLCQEKDDELVKGALPFWPRLFNKLALDNDRRLREATHVANEQLLLKVKKSIAPFLKSVMGAWSVSLCDPYAPASSAARNALNSAIPVAKQSGAFDFCKEEIFYYLQDILLSQTAKTLSGDKGAAAAEMEERYCRLVSGCLKALKLFLATVEFNDTNRDRVCELVNKLLEDDKFWKYSRHKDSPIRSSWYAAISAVCQFLGNDASRHASKVCPLTLGRLSEADPVVAPLIWDASLCILVNIKDCWEHVNANKAFVPQLWNFLKEGGKGNAFTVFPSLLPLLSKIPVAIVGDEKAFYHNFFTNLRHGLFLEKVQASSIETNAVIGAFVECLKYVQAKQFSSSNVEPIREDLLIHQLLPTLKTCITDSHALSPKLGGFLLYLESELKNEDAANSALTAFWLQFVQFCETVVTGTDVQVQANLASFFHGLHSPVVKSVRTKVKFELQPSDDSAAADILPTERREWNSAGPFASGTQKLCLVALRQLKSNPNGVFASLLFEMCRAVCSKQLFAALVECKETSSPDEAPFLFFIDSILPLLLSNSRNKELVRHLVDLVVVVSSCTSEEYVFRMLHELCESKDPAILEELICKAAQSKQGPFWDWLKSDQVGELVLAIARKLADLSSAEPQDEDFVKSSWKILNLCLASSKYFVPLIRTEYLRELLDIFHASIQTLLPICREPSSDVTQIIEFVCDLALNLFDSCVDCWCIPAVEKLLLTLFHFSCYLNDLPLPAKEKVEATWCNGTKKLVYFRGGLLNEDGFLYLAGRKIHDLIVTESNLEERSGMIESLATKLLTSVYKALPENEESKSYLLNSATICSILEVILPSEDDWQESELTNDIFLQLLRGECTLAPFQHAYQKTSARSGTALTQMARVSLRLLGKMVPVENDGWVLDDSNCFKFIRNDLLFLSLAATHITNSRQILEKDIINDIVNMFTFFTWEDTKDVLDRLTVRATEKGCIWSLCLANMVSWLKEKFPQIKDWCKDFVSQLEFDGKVSTFHTLQCFSALLDNKDSEELASKVICHLVSLEDLFSFDAVGHLGLLSQCQFTDEISTVLEFLHGIRTTKLELFVSERQLTEKEDRAVKLCTSVATLFRAVVSRTGNSMSHSHWDVILCSLTGWMQSCKKSRGFILENSSATNFACQTLNLLLFTSRFMQSDDAAGLFNGELVTEWNELYLQNIRSTVLPLFIWLQGVTTSDAADPVRELIRLLAFNLEGITVEDIVKYGDSNPEASCSSSNNTTPTTDYYQITSSFYPLLTHSLYTVQLIGHNICYLLIGKVPHLPDDSQMEDEKMRPPPNFIAEMLDSTSQVVETILSDLFVGDCCIVRPNTDAFTYTQAYLFTWLHMLKLFNTASSEVRSEYAVYLQQQKYLQNLLANLFRLMPNNPSLSEKAIVTPTRGGCIKTMFTEPFDAGNDPSSHGLQHLACQVYLETLRKLPAMVRQWWTNQDNRTTDIVNKYTTDYVSNYICSQEIKCVQNSDVKFENMTVRARPTAREVVARYSVDEITIELVIQLPPNHPLGPVQVETCQRVGVGQTQWRNWMLQLTTFLTYQNGSILDGLSLWKCNVDKRFEGIEECMICFYVLHGSTCQLPKLMCKTCKKKYHSACLYKWFSTSNNSACPLCRNLF